MLQVLIIDDEAHIRDSLAKLLARHCPQATVAGEATGVASGLKAIQNLHPDLVLLDIQMADGTGFDLLNALPAIDFKIIFVTAFDQFALQAFKFSAVDYLLKPVNPEALAEAVNRAEQQVQAHHQLQMQVLKENLKNIDKQHKKIILKTTENVYLLNLQDLISCESDDNYTRVYTTGGEKILVSKTLKDYEEMLAGCGFYRVHKSYLINLAHIKRFEKQEGGYIILTNDLKIPVASRKRDEMMEMLEKMAE
jgi:two-component system, LytTR family, response regulator